VSIRLRDAAEAHQARYRQVGEPNHVSELSPWLCKSRFHQHLAGIDADLIASASAVPTKSAEDPRLYLITLAVERVLRRAYSLVEELHHVDAKVLNTFQVGVMSQDPFQRL
jgi:hypothetical protein